MGFVALPALATLAAAIGNSRQLKLKKRWCEPAVIWAAICGHSGSRKSPANELTLGYLESWEADQEKWHEADKATYDRDLAQYQAAFSKWKKDFKGEQPVPPVKPVLKRIIVRDSTVEALGLRFVNNPRGLLLNRDELSGFFGGMDAYKSSGGHADESGYLLMHGARHLTIDRVTRDSIRIKHAALSICGAITTEVLAAQMTPMRFASGLAARFLFVMPPEKLVQWSEDDISETNDQAFGMVVERLLTLQGDDDGDPITLRLSPDAKEKLVAFHNELCLNIFHCESGNLSAAWSKQLGYTPRFALIIQLVNWADGMDNSSPMPSTVSPCDEPSN